MAHQKKMKEDLRSIWNEWSTPHDWGLWQDNPKPTAAQEVLGGGSPKPDVGAEAGGAIEQAAEAPASPKPEHGHGQEHGQGHGSGSGSSSHKEEEEEEEEEEGGAPKVPGFPGYTPSKAILHLAKKVRAGTANKETLVARLKNVSIQGAKLASEQAVKLATSLAHLFDGAVLAVGKVVAPPPRSKSVHPAARAASIKPPAASLAPPPAPAPPAPKEGSPAPAAKELAEGVEAKKDKNGRTYYIKKGEGRIPASQAFK